MRTHPVRLGARATSCRPCPRRRYRAGVLQRNDDNFVERPSKPAHEHRPPRSQEKLAGRGTPRSAQAVPAGAAPVPPCPHEAWCDTAGTPRIDPARVDSPASSWPVRAMRPAATSKLGQGSAGCADGRVPQTERCGATRRAAVVAASDQSVDRSRVDALCPRPEDALLDEPSCRCSGAADVCVQAKKTLFYGLCRRPHGIAACRWMRRRRLATHSGPGRPISPGTCRSVARPADDLRAGRRDMHPDWFEAGRCPGGPATGPASSQDDPPHPERRARMNGSFCSSPARQRVRRLRRDSRRPRGFSELERSGCRSSCGRSKRNVPWPQAAFSRSPAASSSPRSNAGSARDADVLAAWTPMPRSASERAVARGRENASPT